MKETLCNHLLTDPSLNSLAYRLAGDDKADLMQEMALLILEESDEKIEKIANYFNFWCVRVMINITGKRGSFTKKYSKKYINAEDWYFDSQQDYDNETDEVLEKVDDILKHVYWYKRDLFKLYLECGSLRKVEAEVGIPFVSVYNTVKEVKKTIKESL